MDINVDEFELADNDFIDTTEEEEVANPQTTETTEVQGNEEVVTDTNKTPPQATDQTETQRVAQRIKETAQKARDSFIAEQGYVWNGKPITTESEYKNALQEQRQEEERQALIDSGVNELVANKMIEADKYIAKAKTVEQEQLQAQQTAQQEEQARQQDLEKFIAKYSDVDVSKIDKSVWEEVSKGTSLVQAYTEFRLKQAEEKNKVYEQNTKNKQKAPISSGIATHGGNEMDSEDDFLSGFNIV